MKTSKRIGPYTSQSTVKKSDTSSAGRLTADSTIRMRNSAAEGTDADATDAAVAVTLTRIKKLMSS